jgi:hypothetical protein
MSVLFFLAGIKLFRRIPPSRFSAQTTSMKIVKCKLHSVKEVSAQGRRGQHIYLKSGAILHIKSLLGIVKTKTNNN